MNKIHQYKTLLIAMLLFVGMVSCGSETPSANHPAEPAGHTDEDADHDEHAGHEDDGAHGAHEDEGDEGDEGEDEGHSDVIHMTDSQLSAQGVELAPLVSGVIVTHLTLPAEVGFNQDTLLHISPRAPGIAEEVSAFLGDDVIAGQKLATLQSLELGEAKIALLQTLQTEALAHADLERQQTISSATETLLEIMRTEPSLDELQEEATGLRIGENKGRLISGYARLKAADARHEMEVDLHEKGLSTESSLIAAHEAYNSALAEYMGIFEEIDFMFRVRLQEAQRAERTAAFSVLNAKRRLHLFGLSEAQIEGVSGESPSDIARYEIKSPGAGRIVVKHITPGEKISGDGPVYTVALLDTVWLNIAVYEQYLDEIREGQSVVVHAGGRDASGRVIYVSAMLNEGTRTVTARVVLDNTNRDWRPGEFVTVRIETGQEQVARRAPLEAVQEWEGQKVVFVRVEDRIEPRGVRLGRQNDEHVEILSDDLPIGTVVVVQNSFLMKAELGKSSAGHGH